MLIDYPFRGLGALDLRVVGALSETSGGSDPVGRAAEIVRGFKKTHPSLYEAMSGMPPKHIAETIVSVLLGEERARVSPPALRPKVRPGSGIRRSGKSRR